MKKIRHPTAFISTRNFVSNVKIVLKNIGKHQQLFPVIKANAYGHGAVQAARVIEKYFPEKKIPLVCVARISEARELFRSGFKRNILVLNEVGELDGFSHNDLKKIQFVLGSFSDFDWLKKIKNVSLKFHIDMNTGMNRLGFKCEDLLQDISRFKKKIQELESAGHEWRGLMSHLACGDDDPKIYSREQERKFIEFTKKLKPSDRIQIHISNSGGAFQGVGSTFSDAVRVGIHLWGLGVINSGQDKKVLKPVMSLKAPLRQIQVLQAGQSAGYARAFKARKQTLLGVFQLGYADGFLRCYPGLGIGLVVDEQFMPVVGRVSMDLCHVDLSGHKKARQWLKLWRQNKLPDLCAFWISPEQDVYSLAKKLSTIPYEIVCGVNSRVERVWVP